MPRAEAIRSHRRVPRGTALAGQDPDRRGDLRGCRGPERCLEVHRPREVRDARVGGVRGRSAPRRLTLCPLYRETATARRDCGVHPHVSTSRCSLADRAGRGGPTRMSTVRRPRFLELSRVTTPSQTAAARAAADTVDNAAATPEKEQPYAALGLKPDEYARIREILGRRPTSGELAMYSVMWSEHCSYKSSKIYLRQFGEKVSDEMKTRLMVGMGQNAGVVDIGEGWAVTFKVESHNHPSYIEPFQGAATGVGGIVRDIISMGARPVAVMDQLRFGAIDNPDTARVVHGVVSRHLVLRQLPRPAQHRRRDRLRRGLPGQPARQRARGRRPAPRGPQARQRERRGQQGRAVRRPHRRRRHRRSIDPRLRLVRLDRPDQAPRGAGRRPVRREGAHRVLPRAVPRRARRGDPGPRRRRHLVRDQRARRQRRQRHARRPREGAAARPVAHARGDPHEREPGAHDGDRRAREARRVPRGRRQVGCRDQRARRGHRRRAPRQIFWHGEEIVDVDPSTVAVDGPVYERPVAYPTWIDALRDDSASALSRVGSTPTRCARQFTQLVASPNLADTSWVTNQYDYYVMGNTALSFPDDAGMIRVDEHSGLGFAIATDCNGRFCQLDPYEGAKLALAEAYRNVAVTGAVPDRRHRLPQLRQPREPRGHVAVLAGGRRVCPTDASSSASRSPAATSRSTTRPATSRSSRPRSSACSASSTTSPAASRAGWQDPGENIYLLGVTATELSGSAWAGTVHGHLGGRPPAVDLGTREAARRAAARGIPAVARLERPRPVVRRPRAGARRGRACASASARACG